MEKDQLVLCGSLGFGVCGRLHFVHSEAVQTAGVLAVRFSTGERCTKCGGPLDWTVEFNTLGDVDSAIRSLFAFTAARAVAKLLQEAQNN